MKPPHAAKGSAGLPVQQLWLWAVASSLTTAMAYAVCRYHVFGTVPWAMLPSFTANKAVAVAAVLMLAAAYTLNHPPTRVRCGLTAVALVLVHVALTLPLLAPGVYPALYLGNTMNMAGLVCVTAGTAGAVALAMPALASARGAKVRMGKARWLAWQRAGYAALLLVALHVLPIGFGGWTRPGSWPAAMPPITLASFLIALFPIARRLGRVRADAQEPRR